MLPLLLIMAQLDAGVAARPRGITLSPSEVYAHISPTTFVVKTERAMGSGVVVGHELVVTNLHVVSDARSISVSWDEQRFDARLQKSDSRRDLAILHVPGLRQAPPRRRQVGTLRVGERVYALGSPSGLEQTFSEGIVSSIRKGKDGLTHIQHTAPITKGSSGGGLFDDRGNLIGINTFFALGADGAQSGDLNFAGPANWIDDLLAATTEELADAGTDLALSPRRFSVLRRPTHVDCRFVRQLRFAPSLDGELTELIESTPISGGLFIENFDSEYPQIRDYASPPTHDEAVLSAIDSTEGIVRFKGSRWASNGLSFFISEGGAIGLIVANIKEAVPRSGASGRTLRSLRLIIWRGECTPVESTKLYQQTIEQMSQRQNKKRSQGPNKGTNQAPLTAQQIREKMTQYRKSGSPMCSVQEVASLVAANVSDSAIVSACTP